MGYLRNFGAQSWLSYRALFFWLSPPAYISNVVLAPFLTMALFVLTGRFVGDPTLAERFGVSMIAFGIVRLYMSGVGQSFANDRSLGTLQFLYASRQSWAEAYFAKGAGHFVNGPLAAIFTVVLAALLLDFDVSSAAIGTCFVATLTICLSLLMAAMLVGNFAMVMEERLLPISFATGALLAFTGVTIPPDALPPGLYHFAQVLPLTHGLPALREGFAGAGLGEVVDSLLLELGIALLYAVVGAVMFALLQREALRRGILSAET